MASAAIDMRPGVDAPLAAFVADEATRVLIERAVGLHWPGAVVATGGLGAAATYLASAAPPDILVIDLGDSQTPFEDLMQLADICSPATEVVALGTVNDLALYKQFIAAGVADYLVKPVDGDELESALLAASMGEAPVEAVAPSTDGKLVVVIGARGGVGASTLAINGAWIMAEELGHKTALVDLDVQYGTTALALDLVPSGGLLETLRNPGRLDSLFMASALLPKTDKLSILAAEEDLARDSSFRAEGTERLVEEVRRNFAWVWLDLPRALVHLNANVLAQADRVLIVSDLSLAGLRDTLRLFSFCEGRTRDGAVGVIVNQSGTATGMTEAQFAKGLPQRVLATLETERKAGSAAVAGEPIVAQAKRGKYATVLRKTVEAIAPREAAQKRGGLLGAFRRKGDRR
jgi:pilus assembly protein CpaE